MKTPSKVNQAWDLKSLESFFNSVPSLPTEPLKLNVICLVTDLPAFIQSHLEICGLHNGDPNYEKYYERLIQVRDYVTRVNNQQHEHAIY